MAFEHHPITTSAVILLNSSHALPNPPPSPPSPATPCEGTLTPALDELPLISSSDAQDPVSTFDERVSSAVHILGTEATALSFLTRLYETDPIARGGFNAAVEAITRRTTHPGKVIVSGVGKSGYICQKLVATLKSLQIRASYLHPTEALHGDLGLIDPENDTILLITYSGSTPELLEMLKHLPSIPLIVMTRHIHRSTCEIIKRRPDSILLPAPIHISETDSFGVNAPTTSTTACLALCDALAIVLANHIHSDVGAVFAKFHPGGAIGAASKLPRTISKVTTKFSDISIVDDRAATGAHILMAAYRCKTRWVRQGNLLMSPSRIERIHSEYLDEPAAYIESLMVPRKDWIEIADSMHVSHLKELISSRQLAGDSRYANDGILAVMDDDEVSGVMEIGDLMKL